MTMGLLIRRHRSRLEEFDNAKAGVPDYKGGDLADAEDAEPVPAPDSDDADASELKGKALDEALEAAGLPKTGTADEKRARLAEHTA